MRMTQAWTWAILLGLPLLAASVGATLLVEGVAFGGRTFVAMVFLTVLVSDGLAVQLHRRGLGRPTLVAGLGAALSTAAFFGAPMALRAAEGALLDQTALAALLGLAPLVTGAIAAAGALYLAHGVDRYRALHGLRHAPR